MVSAPMAGAERNRPSPHGPVSRMSRAKIGSSAVAPPRNTANMSSDRVPRMMRSRRTKRKPPSSDASAERLRAARRRLHPHQRQQKAAEAPQHDGEAVDRRRTEQIEHAAERRADDLPGLVGGGEPRHRRRHDRARHQRGDDRRHGRDLEGAGRADHGDDEVYRGGAERARRGRIDQDCGGAAFGDLAQHQDDAVVVAVRHMADEHRQHQHRRELREPQRGRDRTRCRSAHRAASRPPPPACGTTGSRRSG